MKKQRIAIFAPQSRKRSFSENRISRSFLPQLSNLCLRQNLDGILLVIFLDLDLSHRVTRYHKGLVRHFCCANMERHLESILSRFRLDSVAILFCVKFYAGAP